MNFDSSLVTFQDPEIYFISKSICSMCGEYTARWVLTKSKLFVCSKCVLYKFSETSFNSDSLLEYIKQVEDFTGRSIELDNNNKIKLVEDADRILTSLVQADKCLRYLRYINSARSL
jgi:ribosome-binding protein aMBF1 (putative translation factor)